MDSTERCVSIKAKMEFTAILNEWIANREKFLLRLPDEEKTATATLIENLKRTRESIDALPACEGQ